MVVNFATCERQKALDYIKQVYPSKDITDSIDSAGALLDFVSKDIVRIQDPSMYGDKIGVIPGKNWDEAVREDVIAACDVFQESQLNKNKGE